MTSCESCHTVVPAHLDACPHCRGTRLSVKPVVRALGAAALLGLAGCSGDDTETDTGGPEPEYGVPQLEAAEDAQ